MFPVRSSVGPNAISTAVTVISVWLLNSYVLTIPVEVASASTVLILFVVSFFVKKIGTPE